jgi:transposase
MRDSMTRMEGLEMSRERIEMHRRQDLVRMHREGKPTREIARQLQISPNTERKYSRALEEAGLLAVEARESGVLCALCAEEFLCSQRPYGA